MNARRRFLISSAAALGGLAAFATGRARAQGYGGLGADAPSYAPVTPGRRFDFPADHGPHADFRIEWWYVTANLKSADGRPFGVQWTLFRQAISPDPSLDGWAAPQIWMGHAAATSAETHASAEKYGRGGTGQAGVHADPFRAWIDDWRLESVGKSFAPLRVSAAGEGFSYDLRLDAEGPLVLQGRGGYSRKSDRGQASYYYSQPFLRAAGTLTLGGATVEVSGPAWFDREWSSQPLDADQAGWDWFSLHLSGGDKLMLYRVRGEGADSFDSATWIHADGRAEPLPRGAVSLSPLRRVETGGREIPVEWSIEAPSLGLSLRTAPVNEGAFNDGAFAYWEGPIRFEGSQEGRGYMELTGY